MLFLLYIIFLQCSSLLASPIEPSILSIPVRDIIDGDLSAHEDHPHFMLYTRWLESPQGSYINLDPRAAFRQHKNVVSIDCHGDLETCLVVSRLSFKDITGSASDLDQLRKELRVRAEQQAQEQTIGGRDTTELSEDILEKRDTYDKLITVHHKTYHDLGPDNPDAGYQHYITWNLKCETVQFSSSGMQLTSYFIDKSNGLTAVLHASIVGEDPAIAHGVFIRIHFTCGWLNGKCCLNGVHTDNTRGSETGIQPPKVERMECVSAQDVSNQNCDEVTPGWCGLHITQYQKNQGPGLNTENYRFDIMIYDGDGELVNGFDLVSIPSGETRQIGTKPLQTTLGLTAPNVDADPITLTFNGVTWDTNDKDVHHCSMGKYDSGNREGDCGFTC